MFAFILVLLLLAAGGWYGFFSGRASHKPVGLPPGFDWQGHRGCRGLRPENSIPAFLHALDFPEILTLELDLAVSKDNQLIVSHEPWFHPGICRLPTGEAIGKNRATPYLIYQYTAEEIRGFDCGSNGNSCFPQQQKLKTWKPSLRELVEALRRERPDRAATIRWNLEIKSKPDWDGRLHPPVESFAQMVIDELEALGMTQHVNVQSFDVRVLQALRRLAPGIRLGLLIENIRGLDYNLKNLGFIPDIYSPPYQLVGSKLAGKCHAKGMRLIPWTVNEVGSMRKMIRYGVDGIITDYPNRIREVSRKDNEGL